MTSKNPFCKNEIRKCKEFCLKKNARTIYSRSRKKEKCFASIFLLYFSHELLKAILFLDIETHRKMPFKTSKLKCQKGETRLLQKFDLLKLFSCAVKLNSNLRDWQATKPVFDFRQHWPLGERWSFSYKKSRVWFKEQ